MCPEESIQANCMSWPDKFSQAALCDDLYTKVPQTNSVLQSDIKLCNTLMCLTLFKDHPDDIKCCRAFILHCLVTIWPMPIGNTISFVLAWFDYVTLFYIQKKMQWQLAWKK